MATCDACYKRNSRLSMLWTHKRLRSQLLHAQNARLASGGTARSVNDLRPPI